MLLLFVDLYTKREVAVVMIMVLSVLLHNPTPMMYGLTCELIQLIKKCDDENARQKVVCGFDQCARVEDGLGYDRS